MCGICGKLSWSEPPDRSVVERITDRLAHRGPDAAGLFARGPIALGHRRLSVIDPAAASDQPLWDGSGRYTIIFNGEIYNYRALRSELEGLGASFHTASDTEVLLEGYKQWGLAFVERLNGMFAFALWDTEAETLLLVRDRLGKKPLYYSPLADGGLVFASELRALIVDPAVPRRIDPAALGHYLSLNYTHSSAPILAGVRQLEPAHLMVVQRGQDLAPRRYWDLARHFRSKRHFTREAEAAEEVTALLDDAVRLRLESDVPLGAFLSGGIDSSAIVASLIRLRSPEGCHTFSIGFAEKTYSELAEARFAAGLLGVHHHDQVVTGAAEEALAAITGAMDEPFADSSMIPTYFLARFARQFVTVALSGDGGDELFAGYETYVADRLHRAGRFVPRFALAAARRATALLPVSHGKVSLDYKLRKFLAGHGKSPAQAHVFWRTIFEEEEKARLLPDLAGSFAAADPFAPFERHRLEVEGCHPLDQAQYVDLKTWLPDDILVKVDRATMAHALEARAPFLDHRLVELAASLPPRFKLKGLRKKHILKLAQRGRLPAAILERKKAGFNAPVAPWLNGPLRPLLEERLLSPGRTLPLPLDRGVLVHLAQSHARGEADQSLKLFGLLNLIVWCEEHGATL